jgi:Tfp pilus assembly protein PilO
MTISSRVGVIIGLGVLALLIGAAGLLAIVLPQRAQEHRLATTIQQAQTALLSSKTGSAQETPAQATDLFRLSEAMPTVVGMPMILRDLVRLTTASGLTLDSVKPSPVVAPASSYSVVPLVVVVSGRYAGVTSLLQRLEQAVRVVGGTLQVEGRLFDVDQLQLTSTDGETVNATLNLDAFVYGTAAATPTAVASTASTTTSTTATPG